VRRLRRNIDEPRLEIMPLIDVIFLLLTFFVFALVVMVRADVLDIRVPRLTSGTPAEAGSTITIAVRSDGEVLINGEPAGRESFVEAVRTLRDEMSVLGPPPRILVAADIDGRSGDLLDVFDRLKAGGLGEVSVIGAPKGNETP